MGSCQSFDGKADAKQKGKPQIIIKSFTWSRDSHGLFDYESKNLAKNTLKSHNSGVLVRKNNDILFNTGPSDPTIEPEAKDLVNLNIREGNYWVHSLASNKSKKGEKGTEEEYNNNEQSIWMVVKSFKSSSNKAGYKLSEGDLIKLGRIKFRVKEFRGSNHAVEEKKNAPEKLTRAVTPEKQVKTIEELPDGDKTDRRDSKSSIPGSNKSLTQTCRICLGEESDADDPFFCPCNCSGTMKYIHVLCLQKWLKGKIHHKNTTYSTSIYWKTLECELCKVTYPSSFTVNNKNYDIVEITRPDCAFIMLEILSKEKNILRGLHIIKMDNNKNNVKLGRGHDSDIRITDISVSRCHALIKLDKGNYYLEDNNSKFGTLVHLKKPFPLLGDYNNISLQIGRSVVSFSVKKNWKALSNCFGGNVIREPTEVNDDELSPINQSHNNESHIGINRAQTDFIDPPQNVGPFDINSNREEEVVGSQNIQEIDAEGSVSDIPNDDDIPNPDELENPDNLNGENAPQNENHQENVVQGAQQNQQPRPEEEELVVENVAN